MSGLKTLSAMLMRMIDTPKVDWLALSPTLALLGVAAVTLLVDRLACSEAAAH